MMMPIYVEEAEVPRVLLELQNISKHTVIHMVSHMVRNNILHPADSTPPKRLHHPVKLSTRPQLRIQQIRIGNIVAMHASATSLKHRRSIDMGNTKLSKIPSQPFSIYKPE